MRTATRSWTALSMCSKPILIGPGRRDALVDAVDGQNSGHLAVVGARHLAGVAPHPRFKLHFTPTYRSPMNLVSLMSLPTAPLQQCGT